MMYFVPKDEGLLKVPVGAYICDTRFNHIQKVKPSVKGGQYGYLTPCKKCGHTCFYGYK